MFDIGPLIHRWQRGDQRAAETIYNQYHAGAFSLAYALLGSHADAEEVTQDALTYALTHIERYNPRRARFTTWLHTITVSRCRNKRRRKQLPGLSLFRWRRQGYDVLDPAPTPERATLNAASRDEIWAALQSLKAPLREAVILRHWADYTFQEMAGMLGCSMRTAQSRVRTAHKQLESILSEPELAGRIRELR